MNSEVEGIPEAAAAAAATAPTTATAASMEQADN